MSEGVAEERRLRMKAKALGPSDSNPSFVSAGDSQESQDSRRKLPSC